MKWDRALWWWKRMSTSCRVHLYAGLLVAVACGALRAEESVCLRADLSADQAGITWLSWDTEGGPRTATNLLRAGQVVTLRVRSNGQWQPLSALPVTVTSDADGEMQWRATPVEGAALRWQVRHDGQRLSLQFSGEGQLAEAVDAVELVFPFDPHVTPTTVLPSDWSADNSCELPAVISAPDFGQQVCRETSGRRLRARLEGSREQKIVDFIIKLPDVVQGGECALELGAVHLPPPAGLSDTARWPRARRGWFGTMQPSAQWGEQDRPFSAPAGLLANNVISDPASCSLWFYADQILWTPQITPDVGVAHLVRRTIDWWLDHRTHDSGEVVCYWDYTNFLDANAGPLIAAWDYVEAVGDDAWLGQRIGQLEHIAEFLASRDVDGDGMVEATQSGNRGTLHQPHRSCAWWDALNCGHKDGYTNALIYRAWRCLAELEQRLGRTEQCARYQELADRLQATYAKTLFNPATGWLAWWKSEDGELHDYASTVVNGLAIEYGLVAPDQGREILDRLWAKIHEVGFDRFDLGIPPMLVPVARSDYLLPDAIGIPQREDGTDTLGHYQNGGITAGHTLHFLVAHYVVGQGERADMVLDAMLGHQAKGLFQNGVQNVGGLGIDWTDWQGNPTGYEGYLADSFRFLQAVLLREPAFRARYHRPLGPRDDGGRPATDPTPAG